MSDRFDKVMTIRNAAWEVSIRDNSKELNNCEFFILCIQFSDIIKGESYYKNRLKLYEKYNKRSKVFNRFLYEKWLIIRLFQVKGSCCIN